MPTLRENARQVATTVSGTGAVTILAASGNGAIYRDIVGITITTANTVAGTLTFSDGVLTAMVVDFPAAAAAPPQPFDMDYEPPMQQSNPNKAWTVTASANAGTYHVNVQYVER